MHVARREITRETETESIRKTRFITDARRNEKKSGTMPIGRRSIIETMRETIGGGTGGAREAATMRRMQAESGKRGPLTAHTRPFLRYSGREAGRYTGTNLGRRGIALFMKTGFLKKGWIRGHDTAYLPRHQRRSP